MKAFTIDEDNNITAFASPRQIGSVPKGTQVFCTSEELSGLVDHWPGGRLVNVWNGIPGVSPVKRFTSRGTAAARLWKAIQNLEPEEAEQPAPKNKSPLAKRKSPSAADSKIDQIIELLRNPKGATLAAIMRTTGWQPHSVRGFISGQLKNKRGLKVRSFKRDGERVYALKGESRGKNR